MTQLFRKQFLLTTKSGFKLAWELVKIGHMNLYFHPELAFNFAENESSSIYLLGSIYDWEEPHLSNKQIVNRLIEARTLSDLLLNIARYNGEYVVICKYSDNYYIFNDTCAQAEIYFDVHFCSFATQPKLLAEVEVLIPYEDQQALDFYSSKIFKKKCLFIDDTTHVKNIKHLVSNHYIDITNKRVERYFPLYKEPEREVNEVAEKAALMLKGYVKAVALRNPLALGVTAGHDSRVLFLASLGTDCKYFVYQHPDMSDKHEDVTIPKKLTSIYRKNFTVLKDEQLTNRSQDEDYTSSIDFPRPIAFSGEYFTDHVYINGNISEVARNLYGYYKNANAKDFAYLCRYTNDPFAIRLFQKWLDTNKPNFEKTGYNYLDMFYWEQRMGIWAAKTKTEARAIGREMFSPFNSRELLTLLLSVNRRMRDNHITILYNKIAAILSDNNKEVLKIPYNPCPKQRLIWLMNKLRIFNLYRYIGLKMRKLTS